MELTAVPAIWTVALFGGIHPIIRWAAMCRLRVTAGRCGATISVR